MKISPIQSAGILEFYVENCYDRKAGCSKSIHNTQKEGVFVYHEQNIAKEETREDSTGTSAGEGKGVMDENKIVPIVNKANPADSGDTEATAGIAAQMVAQHAAIPAALAVGQSAAQAIGQAAAQPVIQAAGQSAAQAIGQAAAQPVIQAAGQSAAQVQMALMAGSQAIGQSAAQVVSLQAVQPAAQVMGQPVVQATGQSAEQPGVQVVSQPAEQPASDHPAPDTGSQEADTGSAAGAADRRADSDSDNGHADLTEEEPSRRSRKRRSFRFEPEEDDFDFDEDERPKKRFFRFRSASDEESRDKMILSRIKDEDLMEYLALEQRRLEFLQQAKEAKEKRILIAFQLLISLAAIVGITYLLQDNPTILISILYIVGIIAALNVWRNPHDKGWGKRKK